MRILSPKISFSSLFMALAFSIAVVSFTPVSAHARDLMFPTKENWLAKDRFQVRLRAIGVIADGEGEVRNNNSHTDVGNAVTPELDLTYFFTNHFAAELIAATAQHQVDIQQDTNLGDVWILPPTLTLQYHFTPDNDFSPYIGAGVNYSVFYGEEDGNGVNDFDVGNGWGLAAQAGFDYWINNNWGLNLDVKHIWLDVDVSTTGGTVVADDVDINPWIIGAGISYRF